MRVLERVRKNLYRAQIKNGVETYIFHSQPSASILLDQSLAGKELKKKAIMSAKEFLKDAYPICLKGEKAENVIDYVLLCGGNYYGIKEAYEKIFHKSIRQAYIGIKRHEKDGRWQAEATYFSFDAIPDNATVIIGDTIATCSSIKKAVGELINEFEGKKLKIKKIIVYTIAGTALAARILKQTEDKMKKKFPEAKIYYFASEALFGLEENGSDMPFFHKDTIMTPEIKKMLNNHPAIAKRMKCCVFDWGDRCKNPQRHYKELIEYIDQSLKKETDDMVKGEMKLLRIKAHKEIRSLKKHI